MEFQEAMTRFMFHKPTTQQQKAEKQQKWRVAIHRSSSTLTNPKPKPESTDTATEISKQEFPLEFLCPISGFVMHDPVIVSSGHTFERACVQACNTLGFNPILADGSSPDFSTVIPNLALKSAILNWRKKYSLDPPKTLDFFSAENLVRVKLEAQQQNLKPHKKNETVNPLMNANLINLASIHSSWSSDESVGPYLSTPPLQLKTRPSCYSSSSSSEIETLNPNPNPEEEEFVTKLKSPQPFEIEEGLISLRKITRTKEETRLQFCTSRLLSALQPLIVSRYTNIQVNSVACLVNLSLEKLNKVKIVRSGFVPLLIDVLKGGFPEAQEHASGAMFSLALDDRNKTAIGVLGALPPLLHLLRSESERTRHDSALALYHLSLVQSNVAKLNKLGSVPFLLGMVKSGHMESRVLLILCNLAFCVDGRAAILDSGGVEVLVGLLKGTELKSESTRESCVTVFYGLSHGGLRFKGLAKAAGAVEVLVEVEEKGSERIKEKVRQILEMMARRTEEEAEDVNWEELLEDSGTIDRTRCQLEGRKEGPSVNSAEF